MCSVAWRLRSHHARRWFTFPKAVHDCGKGLMSNAGSNVEKLPSPANSGPPEVPSAGSAPAAGSSRRVVNPAADQPTIITGRAPTPCPAASSPADRILEGRVMPGDRLGIFELIEYVGGGGMGRVFRALDTQLDRTVAIKVLPPEQAVDADAAQRFKNEAQSAARLDHENIARVYGVGEDNGLLYIVFEFVEGVNVRELVLRNGSLPLGEAIGYTLQVAEALAHADSRAIVHRDIKPSNLLITPEQRVKLIDMGLARLREAGAAEDDLTASGVTLGTFDYISPEQARDPRNADVRSDIYSLGCTLFFMLAGQPPFPEGTVLQKLLQHQADEPPDIRALRPDLPEQVSGLLRKMMAKDPRRRHAGPAELAADLLRLADEAGVEPVGPAGKVWWAAPPSPVGFLHRHLPWMAPVAALLVAVLLLQMYWSDSASRESVDSPSVATETPPESPRRKNDDGPADARYGSSPKSDDRPLDASKPQLAESRSAQSPTTPGRPKGLGKGTPTDPKDENDVDSYLELVPDSTDPQLAEESAASSTLRGRSLSNADQRASSKSESTEQTSARSPGVLVVSDSATDANAFSSLGAACAAAQDGDVIELKFNGPRVERPLKIANLQLTIRASDGYRPLLLFRPTEGNPVKYSRSMFTLTAGRLTLADVAVELRVPGDVPADNWSLIEMWGGQSLRLERCTLSVRNSLDRFSSYHPTAMMVRARPAPGSDLPAANAPAVTPLSTIELVDCVARGEAAFLSVEDLQPVYMLWDNGLLATSEQLLVAGGGQVAPKRDEMLRLELRHVTAAVRGGLCRFTNTLSAPHQLTVQLVCSDDIILTAAGVPLIEQEGIASADKSREKVLWTGDHNFYPDTDVFWLVRNIDSKLQPETMTFDAWKTYWGTSRESQPSREPLTWKRGPANRPLHEQTPEDYALDSQTPDGAGRPGCRPERLPSEPLSERSTSANSARSQGVEAERDRS
ncbi:MAG: protein kinase [Planctomycetaceae bacterium]|nr:protein kinase [Planctomycetaceae bacterium]